MKPRPRPALHRLVSLDVFRGLTIAGMIVVNSSGSDETFSWVSHSDWNGWTLADLVFPSFLVIMGCSLAISLGRRRQHGEPLETILWQVLRRSLIIFGLGLITSAVLFDFDSIGDFRVMGVLQRIALCYLACSALYLLVGTRKQAWTAAGLLLGYWGLMTLVPVPGHGRGALSPEGNLASYLDRRLLAGHLYNDVEDPEGLLSTLPAIATSLIGVLAGQWLRSLRPRERKIEGLLAFGVVCAMLGRLWGFSFPINKHLWTSSFALFSAGAAILGLTACYAIVDGRYASAWSYWSKPFEIFGRNPLIAYFGSGLLYGLQEFIPVPWAGAQLNLKLWINDQIFASWLAPREASLAYACAFTLLCGGLMAILHRKKMFVKI